MEIKATRKDAVDRFMKGFNCCQSVICAYCEELGVKEEDIFKMTEGFGSGMGGLKDTCGAVTGMFMAISLANSKSTFDDPKVTKMDTYEKFQEAAAKFKEKHDSIYCRDLLTEQGKQPLNCCIHCVDDAAAIVDEMLKEM